MNPLVFYHASCVDGHCCAWLFSKAFPDAELVSSQYGGVEPQDCTGRDVYIADFSFSFPVMERIASQCRSLVLLDHHVSAQRTLTSLGARYYADPPLAVLMTFDMTKSGGRLVWEFLYHNQLLPESWLDVYALEQAPWLVDFSEDRDLWRFKLPFSKEVNAAIRSLPLTLESWDRLNQIHTSDPSYLRLIQEGAAILRREQQIVDQHVKFARPLMIGEYTVPGVNATVLFSEIASVLAKNEAFGACWFLRADGKVQFSLRSTEGGVDVSKVAAEYGGGGHAQAAGFELNGFKELIKMGI